MVNYFDELWDLYPEWSKGILVKEEVKGKTVEVFLSDVPGQYHNFAVPKVSTPQELDLEEIKELLARNGRSLSICLTENQQKTGFIEFLEKNNFVLDSRDCWVGYDPSTYISSPVDVEIIKVTTQTFDDYDEVLGKVFSDFPGNEKYLEMCRKTLTGEIKNDFPGLKSEFFLIYDDQKAVSGGGLFYSKEKNFAYLHDAGTLEEYRGRGYQTNLLRFRINKARGLGINRIYSSVEKESISWRNCLKLGLFELQTLFIFVEKN